LLLRGGVAGRGEGRAGVGWVGGRVAAASGVRVSARTWSAVVQGPVTSPSARVTGNPPTRVDSRTRHRWGTGDTSGGRCCGARSRRARRGAAARAGPGGSPPPVARQVAHAPRRARAGA